MSKQSNNKEIKKLNALLGCDVTGFQRMIDISAIKHSRKKHPNITEADFCLIPLVISKADEIIQGKYPDTVVYRKTLEKEYYYVECTRMGRRRLAMKTFYKTKKWQLTTYTGPRCQIFRSSGAICCPWGP